MGPTAGIILDRPSAGRLAAPEFVALAKMPERYVTSGDAAKSSRSVDADAAASKT